MSHASKAIKNGCEELITAVESGVLAVSTAAPLAGLPEEEQKNAIAAGAKEIARKVRELRAGNLSLHVLRRRAKWLKPRSDRRHWTFCWNFRARRSDLLATFYSFCHPKIKNPELNPCCWGLRSIVSS